MIIYSALNMVNGKRYVGQTIRSLKTRRRSHFQSQQNAHLRDALKKDGPFLWVILDTARSIEELNLKEVYWIAHYNTTDKEYGYNKMSGGRNCKPSDETKAKIGAAGKGRVFSAETRAKMSAAKKGHKHNIGRVTSDETKAKLRELNLGRFVSDETRAKIGAASKGRVTSAETRAKISASLHQRLLILRSQ